VLWGHPEAEAVWVRQWLDRSSDACSLLGDDTLAYVRAARKM
jgi:hypothetical protein